MPTSIFFSDGRCVNLPWNTDNFISKNRLQIRVRAGSSATNMRMNYAHCNNYRTRNQLGGLWVFRSTPCPPYFGKCHQDKWTLPLPQVPVRLSKWLLSPVSIDILSCCLLLLKNNQNRKYLTAIMASPLVSAFCQENGAIHTYGY